MYYVYCLYPYPEYNLNKGKDLGMFCVQHK